MIIKIKNSDFYFSLKNNPGVKTLTSVDFFKIKINVYASGHRQGFLIEKLMKCGLDEQTGGALKTAGPGGW